MAVQGHESLRAPGSRLPPKGTRVAPQIFTEPRNEDVSSDHRNVPWSPENILIDTVARLQQDLADIRAESRQLRTPGVPPVVPTPRQAAFTTTKVPRFGGTTSWEQYRQVFDAIVLSNGWDDATAALQLLSHLEGDALNVALLVPVSCRTWVALRCIFSISKQSDLYLGDQITFPYSRCGLTIAVNSRGTVIPSRQVKVALTRPNILDAFLTADAMCWWNFSSLSIVTPKSFSDVSVVRIVPFIWYSSCGL